MYSHVLTVLAAFAASPAAASSVERWSTIPIANPPSITTMTCTACAPSTAPAQPEGESLPSLAQGEQRLSVEDRNGTPTLVRTEAWMGGSPVTFVSVNPVWVETEKGVLAGRDGTPAKGDGVDLQATTSAVAPAAAATEASEPARIAPVADTSAPNFSTYELRPTR